MTTCTCKKDIEEKLTERFKVVAPSARNHEVRLTGYGFVLSGNGMQQKGCMTIEATAIHPLKKGGEKEKTEKQSMVFSFCPFCGVKYESGAA